jgi:hypothetical protein
MAGEGDIRAGGAYVEIGAKTDGVKAGFAETEGGVAKLKASFRALGSELQAAGAKLIATGGAFAAPALAGIKAFEEYGRAVRKITEKTNV